MSLALDLKALRDRFNDLWNEEITTVFANAATTEEADETERYVRFSISPGNRSLIYGGSVYSQLGRVWLQIFMPNGDGDTDAYELADAFAAIFHEWKSDDDCVRTSDVDVTSIPGGENGMFQVNVSIAWESMRRL